MNTLPKLIAMLAIGIAGLLSGYGAAAQTDATPMATPATVSTAAVFLQVANSGTEADRLVGATTDIATAVEIHETANAGGVMQMRPLVDGLEIPAGETVLLEPGGFHLMLVGINEDLVAGSNFELTLAFETAGDVKVTVPVFASLSAAIAAELPEPVVAGSITVSSVWSRQAPAMGMGAGSMHGQATAAAATPEPAASTGAVFLTIQNTGDTADTLLGATSEMAGVIEIHETVAEGGVMQMRPLEDGLVLDPGATVELAPGGYHLMMVGLAGDLLPSERFEVALEFEVAGQVTVEALIVMGNVKPAEGVAEPVQAGDLVISDVWSRAAPAMS